MKCSRPQKTHVTMSHERVWVTHVRQGSPWAGCSGTKLRSDSRGTGKPWARLRKDVAELNLCLSNHVGWAGAK